MRDHHAPSSLHTLIESLRALPGVGPKSAQRMALYLLQHDRAAALQLSQALQHALDKITHCEQCNTFSEKNICDTCANSERDHHQLCIVETPADQWMIEQTLSFKGLYFVLMGHLSPLDGIGPKELNFAKLQTRVAKGEIKEIILATNFTNEGEATAHYLHELLKVYSVQITRLARGVPVGAELEYVDTSTIARALLDRH